MLKIVGDRVFFRTKFGKYSGEIMYKMDGFYFQSNDLKPNDQSLCDANFKSTEAKEALFKKILGYRPKIGGIWPWCRTREDVIKVLIYLTKEDRKNFIRLNIII